jgi:phenylacetate-CoA ligase
VRLPGPGDRYWSRTEAAHPAEREALILARLQGQLEYAWERSPFYRRAWAEAGVSPDALETLADLRRFPFVTKDDLRADQERHPPFGSNLCCSPAEVTRIHGTSGTTGRPILFGISEDDWRRIGAAHARIMWSFGVRPSDTVFIASFFSLYIGSWGALAGTTALGARAFPFGAGSPGQTERALSHLRLLEPDVFYGTPSYALHLAGAAAERGIDPSSLGFRIMFFSGEPGAGIPATKRRLEETFGAIAIDTGSMAEMTPWMSNAECAERLGMHLWDDVVYTELVDAETGEPIEEGEGVPVYTHLDRTSQPMIRLFSGDLAGVTSAPCPCGRTYRRLPGGVYGRVDDMLIVRGVNVYPHAIENAIRRVDGIGHEYRIAIDRPDELDVLSLEVEGEDPRITAAIRDAVKLATGITPVVDLCPLGSLPTTEFKSRRIADRRTMPQEAATTRREL